MQNIQTLRRNTDLKNSIRNANTPTANAIGVLSYTGSQSENVVQTDEEGAADRIICAAVRIVAAVE